MSRIQTQKVVVVRHGERVDFVFGKDWIKNSISSSGKYTRNNLNMPDSIPNREQVAFALDGPLTQVGSFQATLVGKGLKQENVLASDFQVYVSPALRCLQTASLLLKAMGTESVRMKVEPGLIEWPGWYKDGFIPNWMGVVEISNHGFNVDTNYQHYNTPSEISTKETASEYYDRTFRVVQHALDDASGRDILIVGHRATMDTATRQLIGGERRSESEMKEVLDGVPYCATAIAEKDTSTHEWSLISELSSKMSIRHFPVDDFCAVKKFTLSNSIL